MKNPTNLPDTGIDQKAVIRLNSKEVAEARDPYLPAPYSLAQKEESQSEPGSLLDYWRILRRYKGLWMLFALGGALFGYLLTIPQTPIYEGQTSVEIIGLNENFMNMRDASPVSDNNNTYSETSDMQTQVKILQSDALMSRVLTSMSKDDKSAVHHDFWRKLLRLSEDRPITEYRYRLNEAAKSLTVHEVGQTRLIAMTVQSPDPELAARFANTMTAEFIEQNLESRWKTSEKTSGWLARQLDDIRIKLEHSEDTLQNYARESGLIFNQDNNSVSEDKLHQLQEQLSVAQGDRIAKQSRFVMAQASPPDTLPDVLGDEGLRKTLAKMVEVREQLADLSSTYTSEYSKVKSLQAQAGELQTAYNSTRSSILSRIKNDYDDAVRKEKLFGAAYDQQAKFVTGEGQKAIQYNILKREADSNRQLYDTMLQQLKQSSIAAALRASNIRVVDPATVPLKPAKPQPVVYTVLGFLGGIFFGSFFLIMRERADRTIQQPGDSTMYLSVPELGVIPSLEAKSTKRSRPLPASVDFKGMLPERQRLELVMGQNDPSIIAESFRSTLFSILFTDPGAAQARVLVVSSGSPGEGKSTIASNLAVALAEAGQSVLLVDADMRRPRQHDIFRMNNDRGLSNILQERATLNGDNSLEGKIRNTDIPNLSILTSGPSAPSTTNLLYSSHMRELIQWARENFDVVLIDTPPMLQIPDARIVARLSDHIILVIRAGYTSRDAAIASIQRLTSDGISVMGTILNDWNPKSAPASYSSSYYGRYGNYYSSRHRQ